MVYVIILCVILLVLGLIVSKNNIFSPSVLTPAIWLLCLSLFLILSHKLPPLTIQFLGGISIWLVCFCFCSMSTQSLHFRASTTAPSQLIRDIYFWTSVCTFPFLLLFAYNAIRLGNPIMSWTWNLRLAAIGQSEHFTEPYSPFYAIIWLASYMIELMFLSKKNWKRVLVLVLIYLSYAFIVFAKYIILEFFIVTVVLLYFQKRIKVKYILIGLAVVFVAFLGLHAFRHSMSVSDIETNDFLVLYSIGHMSAFDTLKPCSSEHWGENVFRLYYAVRHALGLSPVEPVDTLLPFIQKPLFTNTYTTLYPFFKDFGYWGIGIFACVLGWFYGWIFKKAQRGDVYCTLLYSYFAFCILMQFVAEQTFTNLAGNIKIILVFGIPFLASKYKMFYYKDEKIPG